ncbi:hypothetical protein ACTNED_07730 [Absicoccus porci]|uniref:hypothetical protein n=1 Tax=Absicoccus porci TaxID=2486576 RepID=UPI003F89A433
MKFSFKHAMASVLISSSMIIPMATPILAESTSTTPITEVKIETPEDFVKYCLSFKKTVDNKTVYEAFKVVDDTNYQTILNSETTYQELAKDETKKDAIDELVKKNTENVYPTYDSLLKAAKDKDASIKAQQEEQAAQEKAAQEQAAKEAAQKEAAQKAEQQATQKTTQTTSSSSTTKEITSQPTTNTTSNTTSTTTTNPSSSTNTQSSTNASANTTTEQKTQTTTGQDDKTQSTTTQDEHATVVANTQPILNTQTLVFTGYANNVKVTVYAQAGAFEQGTQMVVVPLDSQSALEDAKAVLGDNVDQAVSVDISFWKDGKEVEPKKNVDVKLSTNQFESGTNVSVIHDSGDGEVKSVGTSDDASEVTISTSAFSPYTIASEKVIEPATVQAQTTILNQSTSQKLTTTKTTSATPTTLSEQALNVVIKEKTSASTTAQAFVNTYLTSSTGVVYERANYTNYQRILSSKSAWDQLSASEKIQVNSILTKRISKTYTKLYNEAKAMDVPTTNVNTAVADQYVSYTVLCGMAVIGMISVRKKTKSE